MELQQAQFQGLAPAMFSITDLFTRLERLHTLQMLKLEAKLNFLAHMMIKSGMRLSLGQTQGSLSRLALD
jgi:hypothetical protein